MTQRERRLKILEERFRPMVEARCRAADPFSSEAIYLRLAAGEWECALKLLQHQRCDRCRTWRPEPRELLDIPFTDLTRMRQTLDRSLGHLTWEQRSEIAQRLLAADGLEGESSQA